ncbi:serine hydrolase domain-containing protein [Paracnuella aquatica]|uniref:serine hydrolase domain-containing protein n=1 Tax=Paracnuella aquatica TaxID=2268757 RepID=UPI000DF01A68|nr:serine hydrolase domain-containing protein [Paracnuella aquatica]RPD50688.1 class A beta-lactamase-related serine hydrolase [Paracnuella aquatica]
MKQIFLLAALCCTNAIWAQTYKPALDAVFNQTYTAMAGRGGGVTMVLQKGGQTIYSQSRGGFTENTPMLIASASKWYAGLVLMRLVHGGKLRLDDKVSQYIPSFGVDKKNITLLHCFAHTTGLPGNAETVTELMGNRRQSLAEMVEEIAAMPLVAAPGTQFNYGGLSMQVAGRVCEIVTGKSWNQLFETEVVRPLAMTATRYSGSRLGSLPRVAGGISSTAADALKLLEMLAGNGNFRGKQYLTPKEVDLMLADQTGSTTTGYSPFTKYVSGAASSAAVARYAVGNWVIKDGDIAINASPGAFGFTPWIDRQRGYYGVIAARNSFEAVMPHFWKILHTINNHQL